MICIDVGVLVFTLLVGWLAGWWHHKLEFGDGQ